VALELAEDRRRGVARELGAAPRLEPVDRLDQPEARDLKQVVERLVGVRVAQRQVAGERQEPLRQLLARGQVAVVVVADQELALRLACLVASGLAPSLEAGKARRSERCYGHHDLRPVRD
jgi:hypothetical protein